MRGQWPLGELLALITTPAGVSGAVLLLLIQLSPCGFPARPSRRRTCCSTSPRPQACCASLASNAYGGPLARLLIVGALPGVILGAILRAEVF